MQKYIKLLLFLISALIVIEVVNLSRFVIGYALAGTSLIFLSGIFTIIAINTLLGGGFNYERFIQWYCKLWFML